MSRAYNPIYKHARAEVIAEEQEAEAMARNLEEMQPAWDMEYAYRLACTIDAALMIDQPAPCRNDVPRQGVYDPRTEQQRALDDWQAETAQTRESDRP